MAYDEALAGRIRELVAAEPGIAEKKMFGGLAFLVNGNMAVAASGQGGVLVRVDPEDSDRLLGEAGASLMEMRGRTMPGPVGAGEALIDCAHLASPSCVWESSPAAATVPD